MLVNLNIKDFAIVEQLNLEFESGMISLTGETGAGKSIILGAIGLVIGEKAKKNAVRTGSEKAVVSATFDISNLPKVRKFLEKYDYIGDDENECIIRRVIRKDGRSSTFINETSSNLQKTKELGEMLIEIHGQNEHHSLSNNRKKLEILDEYSGLRELRSRVSEAYKDYKTKSNLFTETEYNFQTNFDAYQLLSYQLKELKELNLNKDEYEELETELKHLESATFVISSCEESLNLLNDSDFIGFSSILESLNIVYKNISSIDDDSLSGLIKTIESAKIDLEDSVNEIRIYSSKYEVNEEKEKEIYSRIKNINKISDKMNVLPENIYKLKDEVSLKIDNLNYSEDAVLIARTEMENSLEYYNTLAKELSLKRQENSEKLSSAINEEALKLNLSKDILKIDFLENDEMSSYGIDKIEFLIRPNLGQDYQPIKDIASGGEMSRLALSTQVVSMKNVNIPTMIFDEVDTGLSGETGNVVGSMLRKVGDLGQVICITHLPQVAAQGSSHYFVSKRNVKRLNEEVTISLIKKLDKNERIQEIARMIGGDISSNESFESAKLMLKSF